jgi:hypothetical protein
MDETNPETEAPSQAEIARGIQLQVRAVARRTSFEAEKQLKRMAVEHWFDKLNLKRFL